MTRQLQVAIDCTDPDRLARFWAEALGYEVESPSLAPGEPGERWNAVVDPAGVGPRVLFHSVPEGKVVKNRVHLDVRAGGPRGTPITVRRPLVDAEVTRLLDAEATHVRTIEDESDYFAVMLDPEGNEFCIC
jgi:hypothetical protein